MKKVIVFLCTFLILLTSIIFQTHFLNYFPIIGIKANLGIVLISGIGLVCGSLFGGVLGICYGFFLDIIYGKCFGIYTLLYFVAGWFSGFLNHNFSKENKISMIMLTLLITSVFEISYYFIGMLLFDLNFDFTFFVKTIILESLYNMILTIIFFKPITFWGEIMNTCKKNYYLL